MILEGRQIFEHLENTVSMPAYLYDMAIIHKSLHPKNQPDCNICNKIFSVLPDNFGRDNFVRNLGNKNSVKFKTKNYEAIEKERQETLEKLKEQHRRSKLMKLSFTHSRKNR